MAHSGHVGSLVNAPEIVEARIKVWRECGYNTSEAARRLKHPDGRPMDRATLINTIRRAHEMGLVEDDEMRPANVPLAIEFSTALDRKRERYANKSLKGTWRKPSLIHVAEGPFILKIFGDPHLDADGCDVDLFCEEWLKMDEAKAIYGLCVGDFFNNWIRALSHLWKGEGDPSDAWTIFAYLMQERGGALLAACSGNHDDWTNAPYDPIELLMRQNGVRYRKGAISCLLSNGTNSFTIAMRHKWRGNSMYSAAHGLLRGAMYGWNDDLLIGGHTHQSEARHYVDAKTGNISQLLQIEAFKRFDDYVDVHGFMGPSIAPVANYVVDPSKPRTSPDRAKLIWDHDEAADYLAFLRKRAT